MADLSKTFKVSASPHTIGRETNRRIMLDVLIALLPSFIAGVIFFGLNAIFTVGICMLTCYASEQIYNLCSKKSVTTDLSCLVTGMILGLILPPKTPWYIPVVGSIFAIIFIKMLFGGVGKNIANPAATARVFLLLAFSSAMGSYLIPKVGDFIHIDGTTAPTFLGGGYEILDSTFMGVSGYWGYILQLFFGHVGGSIGETSALAILIGCAYLMIRKVIDWRIPVSFITSSTLMILICYQTASDILPQLLSGGLLFGAVFMATDYATCPKYKHNRVLFGIFIGFMTILLRKYSNYPESVSFVIILANLFVPLLDRFILPVRFGQTNRKGKVYRDFYGMTMQWIIPVFLAIIIIFTSVFAVENPYIQKYYGKYVDQFVVVDANIKAIEKKYPDNPNDNTYIKTNDVAQTGDYLFTIHGKIRFNNDDDKKMVEKKLETYRVVLYRDGGTTTSTSIKVRSIIEHEYAFTNVIENGFSSYDSWKGDPKRWYKEVSPHINGVFEGQTIEYIKNLPNTDLTVDPADVNSAKKENANEFTQTNFFIKDAILDAYNYLNFIETHGVEQFTYEALPISAEYQSSAGIDGTTSATQQNLYSITLQKHKNGVWRVASIINHVETNAGWDADTDLFIGKSLSQVRKMRFTIAISENDKKVNAMNTALRQVIIEAFEKQASSSKSDNSTKQQLNSSYNNSFYNSKKVLGGVSCIKTM